MHQNYLIEHTAGSIIRSAFKIYVRHFGTMFLIYILPIIPVMVIQQEASRSGSLVLIILGFLLTFVVSLFTSAAITVAVSDICIGNVPSLKRSYTKILGKIVLRLLGTSMLAMPGSNRWASASVDPGACVHDLVHAGFGCCRAGE